MANLGDVVEFGRRDEWERYVSELAENWNSAIPYFHVPGGHSLNFRLNGVYPALYEHYFGRTYYFVDINNWRFIFLDTSKTYLSDTQAKWLSGLLEGCGKERKRAVIFTHCPPQLAEQGITHSLTKCSTDKLAQIVSGHEVATIFAAHIHETFSFRWHGIPVFIASLEKDTWVTKPAEYYRVDVNKNELSVKKIEVRQP